MMFSSLKRGFRLPSRGRMKGLRQDGPFTHGMTHLLRESSGRNLFSFIFGGILAQNFKGLIWPNEFWPAGPHCMWWSVCKLKSEQVSIGKETSLNVYALHRNSDFMLYGFARFAKATLPVLVSRQINTKMWRTRIVGHVSLFAVLFAPNKRPALRHSDLYRNLIVDWGCSIISIRGEIFLPVFNSPSLMDSFCLM